jgi:polar amino acid transport system permease protein
VSEDENPSRPPFISPQRDWPVQMNYVFQFGDIWNARWDLVWGAVYTLRLSIIAMGAGIAIAIACALARTTRSRVLNGVVTAYVEIIRNTPLLIQLFLIFFGLPGLGLRMSADVAAMVALSINVAAYVTEILRAGFEAVPKGQVEAGMALGLTRGQVFRKVELFQAITLIFPSLASQYVLTLLAASVVSVVAAPELTTVANDIQARTFRSFEVYLTITAIYLLMAVGAQAALARLETVVFRRHLSRRSSK